MRGIPHSRSTRAPAWRCGTAIVNGRRRRGDDGPLDVWPDRSTVQRRCRYDAHPWPHLLANQDLYDQECKLAQRLLLDRLEWGEDGAPKIEPGTLSDYSRHRAVEWLTAQYVHHVVAPWCEQERPNATLTVGRGMRRRTLPAAEVLRDLAQRLYFCRQGGPFGVADGELVVAWDDKCGHKKLCPDEARQESQRLEEKLAYHIYAAGRGGHVHKGVLTLPNYPPGRLAEGMRYMMKRFRDRLIRSKRLGIEGALVILEAPLSARGDWNIHLNFVLLTKRWLSYRELRKVWGYDVHVRKHSDFSERGLHKLFSELVKYALKSVSDKSLDARHCDDAPPLIEWAPELFVEWYAAHHPFRRTRTYGSLFRVPAPERKAPQPVAWIGRLEYRGGKYHITWRDTNALELMKELLERGGLRALDSVRGYKSTEQRRQNGMRGPP